MAKKNWIKSALRKPGSFTAYAKRNDLSMSEAIERGKNSPNPTTRRRANLAKTLRSFKSR